MPPKKSFGAPNITGATVQELARSVQFWFQHFADRLDTLAGLRGTATFYGAVDAQGNPIQNVGDPTDENSAIPARLTINRKANDAHFDAKGLKIFNLASGANPQDAVSTEQLSLATLQTIENAGAQAPPPAITTASSTGTPEAGFAFADHTHAPLVPFGLAATGQETYAITSVTPTRAYDTATVTLPELANALATLIDDLRNQLLVD